MRKIVEKVPINGTVPIIITIIPIIIVFIFCLLVVSTNDLDAESQIKDVGEYSHKLYENRDEARVICGDFRGIAFSDYRIEGKPGKQYQDIIRQYFEFTDLENGNKKMVIATSLGALEGSNKELLDSNAEFINQKDSYLDGYADSWACLKGNDGYYLAVEYANGGNCLNCQWVEIMNRKGEVINRSIKNRSLDNHKQYKKKLSELGLPQISPIVSDLKHNIKLRGKMLEN
jgi:hypothetical protein